MRDPLQVFSDLESNVLEQPERLKGNVPNHVIDVLKKYRDLVKEMRASVDNYGA